MKKYLLALFYLIAAVSLTACAHAQVEEEQMFKLASQLTKLTAAVESTVRYKNLPEDTSDTELLELATRHDSQLLKNFSDYKIKLLRGNRHATLLICTKDSEQALLADGGCTAKMDIYLWDRMPVVVCELDNEIMSICQ